MTERLYYIDSHMKEFTARVVRCEAAGERYAIVLDRTAFFPEGGGQKGDSGTIGSAHIFDTQESGGEIVHYADAPLDIGAEYECRLDWETRFRRMQNHSGEHIVSGLVHRKYGYNNVGFHMGSDAVTIDFDGALTPEQLSEIEREANYAVAANHAVRTFFPDPETLKTLDYRSKLDLTENVRLVEIESVDLCACCAPHVSGTAEVGIIRILGSERRRRGGDGTRVTMLSGLDAYEHDALIGRNNDEISVLLSAKREETAAAVRRLLAENEHLKETRAELGRALADSIAEATAPSEGNICIFSSALDDAAQRRLVNALTGKCVVAAVFCGSDGSGYKYIIGSEHVDLRKQAKIINAGISGRGGGSPEMIQGFCNECSETIQKLFSNLTF